jgi:hypothetical protein
MGHAIWPPRSHGPTRAGKGSKVHEAETNDRPIATRAVPRWSWTTTERPALMRDELDLRDEAR